MSKSDANHADRLTDGSIDDAAELRRMLLLVSAQLEIATRESDVSMARLTETFTRMLGCSSELEQATASPPPLDQTERWRAQLQSSTQQLSREIEQAIVALQFYDRLCQRLQHVAASCEAVRKLLNAKAANGRAGSWAEVLMEIRSQYSIQEEYEIYDAVMRGCENRAAIEQQLRAQQSSRHDDVEMF